MGMGATAEFIVKASIISGIPQLFVALSGPAKTLKA
jgi:hypothetical protein